MPSDSRPNGLSGRPDNPPPRKDPAADPSPTQAGDDPLPDGLPRLSEEDKMHLLAVARSAVEEALYHGRIPRIRADKPHLDRPGASFVTLWRADTGDLRGCRGEVEAVRPLIQSVAMMAIAAALDDPRFPPVVPEELPWLRFEISVLSPLRPIRPEEVVVGRHGLMIVVGPMRGLLLPEVPVRYGWDRETFLRALCQKAGLPEDAWRLPQARLFAFETLTWEEP